MAVFQLEDMPLLLLHAKIKAGCFAARYKYFIDKLNKYHEIRQQIIKRRLAADFESRRSRSTATVLQQQKPKTITTDRLPY